MNEELYDLLEQEPDETLLGYFEYVGTSGFEKKLIAGNILYKRGYDKDALRAGKRENINYLQYRITACGDERDMKRNCKKKVLNNAAIWLGFIVLLLLLDIFRNHANAVPFNKTSFYIFSGVAVAYLLFRAVRFRKDLSKCIDKEIKERELQRVRMKRLEDEWQFD